MSNVNDEFVGTAEWRQICQLIINELAKEEGRVRHAATHKTLEEIRYHAGRADGIRRVLSAIGFQVDKHYAELTSEAPAAV